MTKQVISFLLINLIFLAIGFGVKQKNPEELFLSDNNLKQLIEYKNQFGEDEITFVSGLLDSDSLAGLESKVFERGGEFVSLDRLLKGHAVFTLPAQLDDELRYQFFKEAHATDSQISFAGGTYTNAQLAGMSIKIQNVIFPIIFVIMFLSLLFIFKSFNTTAYLFLTSFVGVSVGLSVIQITYSYATILTSIAPLVSFILTLANQMHIVFGIHTYKTKKEFLKRKLQPILIMMITTVIGFAGLIFSDLVSIRQFGIVMTITLIITWSINLIFLSNFSVDFHLSKNSFKFKLKRPSYHFLLGLLICIFLLCAGAYSLKKMPTLVEAIFFFSKDHPVRVGHQAIENDLGGTPQFEFAIQKDDKTELSFKDLTTLGQFEARLKSENQSLKILSLNELILKANTIYSGNKVVPEVEVAYHMIKGQVPEMLRKTMANNFSYKISFLAPPLSSTDRARYLDELKKMLSHLPSGFHGKITGLSHLLSESQSHLVTTLLSSLLGSFLLIAFIFALFSRNLKEIFLFAIISLSSIFGGLWLMHLFHFSLNVSSIMVLSISIGLIDDSTIHLLYAQKHGESFEMIQSSCLLPMMFSNIILLGCFFLLGFESFIPIKEFAWGLVLMLSMGLLLDLFVLPMLDRTKSSEGESH